MKEKDKDKLLSELPGCAADFIKLVIKKMRYQRKVRQDVQTEMITHFIDDLKQCKTHEEKEQRAQTLIAEFGDAKLLAILLRRAKKRCRPLWRKAVARTFQAVGVIIICLTIYIVWFFSGKPNITTNYLAELNRIVRPVADDNLNAAPLYQKAVESMRLPDDKALLGKKYEEATAEDKLMLTKLLADNGEALELVVAGSKKPYFWKKYETKGNDQSRMMAVLVASLTDLRQLARLLRWRAQLRAEQGQYDDALSDMKACYRFGRHLKEDKTLIEQLVGIAIEALSVQTIQDIIAEYQIDSATLAALQQDFEQMIADENFTPSLDLEKLTLYDEIQRCFTGDGLGRGHIIPKQIIRLLPEVQIIGLSASNSGTPSVKKQELNWWSKFIEDVLYEIYELGSFFYDAGLSVKKVGYMLFLHPDRQQTSASAQKFYDYWDKLKFKSPAQIRAEAIDAEKESMEIVKGNVLLEFMSPALSRVIELCHRNKTNSQAFVTILAVVRYRQDKGLYPDSLQELMTSGYLKELPMDLYSDKPMVYKKTDGDFILYSVGPNFTDDGGESGKDSKGRAAKWRDNGDAVFWPAPKPQ